MVGGCSCGDGSAGAEEAGSEVSATVGEVPVPIVVNLVCWSQTTYVKHTCLAVTVVLLTYQMCSMRVSKFWRCNYTSINRLLLRYARSGVQAPSSVCGRIPIWILPGRDGDFFEFAHGGSVKHVCDCVSGFGNWFKWCYVLYLTVLSFHYRQERTRKRCTMGAFNVGCED